LSKSFFKTLQDASIQRTPIMQDYEEHPSCNLVKNTILHAHKTIIRQMDKTIISKLTAASRKLTKAS